MWTDTLAAWGSLFSAQLGIRPAHGTPPQGEERVGQFQDREWGALVARFAHTGRVDYRTFRRVRRVLEGYLGHLSDARPAEWDDDTRLAFYLNAYNALVVHQIVLHDGVASVREIPAMFARPYPVGLENLSPYHLLHGKLRAFGDPRIHAAVVPATASAPVLRSYSPTGLQQELDDQLRAYLAQTVRTEVDSATITLILPEVFRWFAGDFAAPEQMPSVAMLARGWVQPALALPHLRPYLPAGVRDALEGRSVRLAFAPYDWSLNGV